jgi:hypothetical protein
MVLPIEQRDVAIDMNEPAPDPMDQFAELDARNWRICCQRKALLASLAALLHAAQENCLAVCELGETML